MMRVTVRRVTTLLAVKIFFARIRFVCFRAFLLCDTTYVAYQGHAVFSGPSGLVLAAFCRVAPATLFPEASHMKARSLIRVT